MAHTRKEFLNLLGWLLYAIGCGFLSFTGIPIELLSVVGGLALMIAGLVVVHRQMKSEQKTARARLVQVFSYGSALFLIPGFLSLGAFSFTPNLIQSVFILGLSVGGLFFVLAAITQVVARFFQ